MRRNKRPTVLIVVIVAIIAAIGYWMYSDAQYKYFLNTPVDAGDAGVVSFQIKSGETAPTIAKNLADKQLILDQGTFAKYVKAEGLDRKILPGRYRLQKSSTIPEIVENFINSEERQLILTIPEGSTIKQIDQKLVDLGLSESGKFVQATKNFTQYSKYPFLAADEAKIKKLPHPLEGYLFPDTYFLDPAVYNEQDLIDIMLKNFQKRLPENYETLLSENKVSLYDAIIMGSIVEKEVRTDKDRPIVAGILWKRLNENWQLGADATLLYLKDDRDITYEDLQKEDPYNTRKNGGLPPGPICNPGLDSIKAALDPETSAYYFYLTKPENGEVVYGRTNDEHNANKAKYL